MGSCVDGQVNFSDSLGSEKEESPVFLYFFLNNTDLHFTNKHPHKCHLKE